MSVDKPKRLPWGEDSSKWVITKSIFGSHWIVFPPNDCEASYFPTFQRALQVLR